MKYIYIILLAFILAGCVYNPDGALKRSKNNTLINSKGFYKTRKPPLYNIKYIEIAKKHVQEMTPEEMQYEDSENAINHNQRNKEMYLNMIEKHSKQKTKNKSQSHSHLNDYNNIIKSDSRHSLKDAKKHLEALDPEEYKKLKAEVQELKKSLIETQKKLQKNQLNNDSDAALDAKISDIKEKIDTANKPKIENRKVIKKIQNNDSSNLDTSVDINKVINGLKNK